MTPYNFQVADGDVPTATELARYKQDRQHAEKQRMAYRMRKHCARIWASLSRIFNRMVLCNSTVSALIAAGTLITTHSFA